MKARAPKETLDRTRRAAEWRRGFATEIARAVIDVASCYLCLPSLLPWTLVENAASRRVMEKLAFSSRAQRHIRGSFSCLLSSGRAALSATLMCICHTHDTLLLASCAVERAALLYRHLHA